KQLDLYHELVDEGNYLEASENVENIRQGLEEYEQQIDEFPELLRTCTDTLPQQLNDLKIGLQGMKAEGYRIQGLGLEEEIDNYNQRLKDCIQSLEKGSVSEVKVIIAEID